MSQVAEGTEAPASETSYDGLRLRNVTKSFGAFTAVDDLDLDVPAGLVLRAARPVRLRQDDHPADGRRARDADVGLDHAGRPGHHLRQAVPPPGQHRLPELCALPAPRHPRERRVRPQAAQVDRRRHPGPRHAGAGRAGQPGPEEAGAALRRAAAAGGARPGADQQARGAAPRRAARCAGPQAAPVDADRAQADPDRGRTDLHPRHPRPGGGHDHGRHGRGHECRRDRADGRPRGAVREPAHHLRRQLPGQVAT